MSQGSSRRYVGGFTFVKALCYASIYCFCKQNVSINKMGMNKNSTNGIVETSCDDDVQYDESKSVEGWSELISQQEVFICGNNWMVCWD